MLKNYGDCVKISRDIPILNICIPRRSGCDGTVAFLSTIYWKILFATKMWLDFFIFTRFFDFAWKAFWQ